MLTRHVRILKSFVPSIISLQHVDHQRAIIINAFRVKLGDTSIHVVQPFPLYPNLVNFWENYFSLVIRTGVLAAIK